MSYTYDADGAVVTTTDGLGNATTATHDSYGRTTSTTDPTGAVTRATYTATGQIATATDAAGKVTTFTYNRRGDLLSAADPLGRTTTNTYDLNDRLLTTTGPTGAVTTFTLYRRPLPAGTGVESSEKLGRHRWIVASCLAWLQNDRRLVRRYERKVVHFHALADLGYRRFTRNNHLA